MSKEKRPSLLKTMNKNKLKKQEKPIKEIEKEIKQLHSDEKKENQEMMRTTVFLPKDLHKKIKVYCATEDDINIKTFITQAIQEYCSKLNINS